MCVNPIAKLSLVTKLASTSVGRIRSKKLRAVRGIIDYSLPVQAFANLRALEELD